MTYWKSVISAGALYHVYKEDKAVEDKLGFKLTWASLAELLRENVAGHQKFLDTVSYSFE